jgi:hypothetical protein
LASLMQSSLDEAVAEDELLSLVAAAGGGASSAFIEAAVDTFIMMALMKDIFWRVRDGCRVRLMMAR